MPDLEWGKDEDTKTQGHQLNINPLHRGNVLNTNDLARVKQRMQWEAPSKLLAVDDPLLLPEREVHDDDDCFYYHSWRNNVVIAFGTLSSFLT